MTYVDNGRDAGKAEVRRAHRAAEERGTSVRAVDPEHPEAPFAPSADVTPTPILPPGWPPTCSHDPNDCSIGLRLDFCSSSVLFMGDAEHDEEARLDPHGHIGARFPRQNAPELRRHLGGQARRRLERVLPPADPRRAEADRRARRARREAPPVVRRRSVRWFAAHRLGGDPHQRAALGDRARRRRGPYDDRGRELQEAVNRRFAPVPSHWSRRVASFC